MPPVWEYLVNRSRNSFLPCIALIDPVGGYELPAQEYAQPQVRRAVTMAATASTLVNDVYSMATETGTAGADVNLPTVIAAEDHCSLREAIRPQRGHPRRIGPCLRNRGRRAQLGRHSQLRRYLRERMGVARR